MTSRFANWVSRLIVLSLLATGGIAAAPARAEEPKAWAKAHLEELVELYRHFHSHPELSFQEKETAARVAKELRAVGAEEKEVRLAADELVRTQREDGGWGQLDTLDSDAYATGSALVALHQAGGLPATDAAYRRGLAFLLQSQQEDGSWLVRSRSKPFQTYYESGFPHGKDQFISMAASAWATTALALACPPPEKAP